MVSRSFSGAEFRQQIQGPTGAHSLSAFAFLPPDLGPDSAPLFEATPARGTGACFLDVGPAGMKVVGHVRPCVVPLEPLTQSYICCFHCYCHHWHRRCATTSHHTWHPCIPTHMQLSLSPLSRKHSKMQLSLSPLLYLHVNTLPQLRVGLMPFLA